MDIQQQITFLPTSDLKTTLFFYGNVLNLELVRDQGDCIIFRTCQNAYIGFCDREYELAKGKIIITLIVDDVENQYNRFSEIKDLEISELIQNDKYKIIHFFISDPNGYLVEVQKFLDPIS